MLVLLLIRKFDLRAFQNFHISVSVGTFEFSVLKSCIIYMLPRLILHFSLLFSFGALRTQCWTLNGHAEIVPHHSSHCVLGLRSILPLVIAVSTDDHVLPH